MLLTMAGRCNAGGMIFLTENVPYTPKMLADELDFEENTVILALQALENLNMIVADNGFFAIAGWDKYQNIDGMEKIKEQNRKRQAKFKKKQKLLIGNVTDNVIVTQGNATEEEKEEEKEKEEENQSIIHSNVREDEEAEKEPTGNFDDRESIRLKYLGGTLGKGVVMLSDEQFADLLDKLSVEEFDKYVSIVAECELKGKRYTNKTHYQAILDMAKKDRKVI